MINVIIKPYKSEFFPIQASYKINNIRYTAVFETVTQLKNYFDNRYLYVNYINKMEV